LPNSHGPENARHQESDVGSFEARSHSFVIRMWIEQAGEESIWRGHITQVVTGKRHHFVELTQILSFIRTCLQPSDTPRDAPEEPQ
jgi:hypothetical protein